MDVTGDRSKVQCCKEQYCIGTWSVRSTNQGKLEVVKQEMARVNIDILGISELKWTGTAEFNLDNHYILASFVKDKVSICVWIYLCGTQFSELNSPIPVHFSLLIPRMSTFTLAISCLNTSNLS